MPDLLVGLFRNLNLGQRGSPDRDGLERALRAAGARGVRSFQTNGTVAFEADDAADGRDVVARALPALTASSGYADAVFVRRIDDLAAVLRRDPFAGVRDDRTDRETFTFFDGDLVFHDPLPWTGPRGDVVLVEVRDGIALGVVSRAGAVAGNPTTVLEKRFGVPATTRTAGTIARLVRAVA